MSSNRSTPEVFQADKPKYITEDICRLMHAQLQEEVKEIKSLVTQILKILNGNGVPGLVAKQDETTKRVEALENQIKDKNNRTFQEKLVWLKVLLTLGLGGVGGYILNVLIAAK